jgi:hypothetical protein
MYEKFTSYDRCDVIWKNKNFYYLIFIDIYWYYFKQTQALWILFKKKFYSYNISIFIQQIWTITSGAQPASPSKRN